MYLSLLIVTKALGVPLHVFLELIDWLNDISVEGRRGWNWLEEVWRRLMDVVKEDMGLFGVREEFAVERV